MQVIIPVKSLSHGKSRLRPILTEEERFSLNCELLDHTLNVVLQLVSKKSITVISGCLETLKYVRGRTKTLKELKSGLNEALTQATHHLKSQGPLLILPVDLPCITSQDLECLTSGQMSIVSDRAGTGTNGIYLGKGVEISYHFGPGSFQLHLKEAKARGIQATIINNPNLQFDLDLPEDLLTKYTPIGIQKE